MQHNLERKNPSLCSNMTPVVQNKIKAKLDELVNLQLDQVGEITPQTWKIEAHNIVKSLKESESTASLLEHVNNTMTSGIEHVISNIENEPFILGRQTQSVLHDPMNETWFQGNSTVGIIQYEQLAQDTSCHKPLKIRKHALHVLNQSVLSEVISKKGWSQMRRNLRENLCEENTEVFSLSLKIHAKLLQSTSHQCVQEGFINLIEGLHLYYSKIYHNSLPSFKSGIDLANITHCHLSQISHLILETAKEMPKNWLRYGERRVEEIVALFINLLAMHTYTNKLNLCSDVLYPFHIFSVLDPKAIWCKQWVHGAFGQNMFFNTLSQNLTLVSYVTEEVLSYVNRCENVLYENWHQNKVFGYALKFAVFSHSLNLLNMLISYEKGRNFYPVILKATEEPITINCILVKMIIYLNSQSSHNTSSDYEIITNFIRNIVSIEFENISEMFLTSSIEPIQQRSAHSVRSVNIPLHTIAILKELACNNSRSSCFLGSRHKYNLPHSRLSRNQNSTNTSAKCRRIKHTSLSLDRQCSAKLIEIPSRCSNDSTHLANVIECVTTSFIRKKDNVDSFTLLSLIDICAEFFSLHEGLSLVDSVNSHLLQSSVSLYKQLSSENEFIVDSLSSGYESQTLEYKTDLQSLYRTLVKFLTVVASTPCGLYALAQQNDILQDLLRIILKTSNIEWEKPDFRYLISLMTLVPQCTHVLSKKSHKILSKSLGKLQSEYEDPIALMTGSDRKQMEAIQCFMRAVFTFVPNLQGVMALLHDSEDSSEDTLVDVEPSPSTLSEMLMFEDASEPWHYVCLLTLQALCTNLDVHLHLNTAFQFKEKLLKLQSENVTSSDDTEETADSQMKPHSTNKLIIIDESSLLRHQILSSTYEIGGPSERIIPPPFSDTDEINNGEPYLFCSFPPPQYTTAKNTARKMRNTRLKGQCDIQKFLQDTKLGLRDANWLSHARRAYKSSRNDDIKPNVILDLLDQVVKLNNNSTPCLSDVHTDVGDTALQAEESYGVQLVVRYGVRCHILQENPQSEDNLVQLLCLSHRLLQKKKDTFEGFDWFLATVYLLCGGIIERCQTTIVKISSLPVAPFIWRAFAVSQHPSSHHVFKFGHLLELLVKIELPLAFSALQLGGVSWWLICRQWMAQCFWNVLDWPQICHWLVIILLNELDYTLYFCVCLLRHLQPQILQATSDGNVWEQIMINPVEGFHVGDQLSFMEKLAKRHRTSVLHHLTSAINMNT